jgi:hypothetical protein
VQTGLSSKMIEVTALNTNEWNVAEMLAYAFKNHRRESSSNTSVRGESFLERCIEYACHWDEQGQLLLDAIYQGRDDATFCRLRSQIVEYLRQDARPDLEVVYSLEAPGEHSILMELKIEAALTAAQKNPGYAEIFLCSSPYQSSIVSHFGSDSNVRVVSWRDLYEQISLSSRTGDTDLSLWQMICSLGEDLARDIRDLEPLASPKALFDKRVADNYLAVMTIQADIVDALGHKTLSPPKPGVLSESPNITAGAIGATSLMFTPESTSSPISIAYEDYRYYESILKVGAKQSYESPKSGKALTVPLTKNAEKSTHVYFRDELAAIKWDSNASAVGRYVHAFLRELRTIGMENPGVFMEAVPLDNRSIGYRMSCGESQFYALFDARRWSQNAAGGPFVVCLDKDSDVESSAFILAGLDSAQTTASHIRDRIRSFTSSELGLPSPASALHLN